MSFWLQDIHRWSDIEDIQSYVIRLTKKELFVHLVGRMTLNSDLKVGALTSWRRWKLPRSCRRPQPKYYTCAQFQIFCQSPRCREVVRVMEKHWLCGKFADSFNGDNLTENQSISALAVWWLLYVLLQFDDLQDRHELPKLNLAVQIEAFSLYISVSKIVIFTLAREPPSCFMMQIKRWWDPSARGDGSCFNINMLCKCQSFG